MKILRQATWLLVLLILPFRGFAHQLDEYLQATLVDIEPGEIRLQVNLTPGVAVADQVLGLIDQDHDGSISTNESAAYAAAVKRDLGVRLDGRNLELKPDAMSYPESAEIRTGWGIIQVEYVAAMDRLAAGPHTLSLENRHLPAVSVYLFNAAQPKSNLIRVTGQKRNEIQSLEDITFDFQPPAKSGIVIGIAILLAALFIALVAGVFLTWPKRAAD